MYGVVYSNRCMRKTFDVQPRTHCGLKPQRLYVNQPNVGVSDDLQASPFRAGLLTALLHSDSQSRIKQNYRYLSHHHVSLNRGKCDKKIASQRTKDKCANSFPSSGEIRFNNSSRSGLDSGIHPLLFKCSTQ